MEKRREGSRDGSCQEKEAGEIIWHKRTSVKDQAGWYHLRFRKGASLQSPEHFVDFSWQIY